jgi:hypothetical protein
MATKTFARRKSRNTDRLLNAVERAIMRQMRRLKKQEQVLKRKQARAQKRLEREQYEWASQGW